MIFEYKALDNTNNIKTGVIEARSGELAIIALMQKQLYPIDVHTIPIDKIHQYQKVIALGRKRKQLAVTSKPILPVQLFSVKRQFYIGFTNWFKWIYNQIKTFITT